MPQFVKASCDQFIGNYNLSSEGCYNINQGKQYPDYLYSGMNITNGKSGNLSMFYKTGSGGYTTSYIPDGMEHEGDIYNTGKTYTATCDNIQIHSIRNGLFIAPIDMTFIRKSNDIFVLTETINSSNPFIRSCTFVRAQ